MRSGLTLRLLVAAAKMGFPGPVEALARMFPRSAAAIVVRLVAAAAAVGAQLVAAVAAFDCLVVVAVGVGALLLAELLELELEPELKLGLKL